MPGAPGSGFISSVGLSGVIEGSGILAVGVTAVNIGVISVAFPLHPTINSENMGTEINNEDKFKRFINLTSKINLYLCVHSRLRAIAWRIAGNLTMNSTATSAPYTRTQSLISRSSQK